MHNRNMRVLAAFVALFCVLAFFATCAAWFLLDAQIALPFLEKAVGVEALLVCGSALLVLCMICFSVYVMHRRARHT